jgi:predicted acylesterase/phospholipase RssA
MKYDMVFEGGGAKGMVFVGALQELEARGHVPGRLLGTSAGSIMATFLAAGYNAAEMAGALNETRDGEPVFLGFLETPRTPSREAIQQSAFRDFLKEINLRFLPDALEEKLDDAIAFALATSSRTIRVFSFLEWGGFYAADNFLGWLKGKLNAGSYDLDGGAHRKGEPRNFGGMTLAEFYRATGVDLSLVAADTSDSHLLILNHRTAPGCPLIYAVRMSMSLPLLWQEVVWQAEWGDYRGAVITGHTVVDGGMLSNFPIELFLSGQPHVTAVMGEKTAADMNVVGFLIDETLDVPGAPMPLSESKAFGISQLHMISRLKNLINTMTQAHDKSVIETSQRFVIRLPARGYGTIEFGMSDQRREALIAAGRQATAAYFDRMEALQGAGTSFGSVEGGDSGDRETITRSADRIATRVLSRY